jgi:Rieske Fe-S protein
MSGSRRKFLKSFLLSISLPLSWLWYSSIKRSNEIFSESNTTIIEDNIPRGISFHDGFIIVKNDSSITILSSRCSHLGCKINRTVGNKIVCPCHGSTYNLSGEVVKGPAQSSLRPLKFLRDKNKIIVYES